MAHRHDKKKYNLLMIHITALRMKCSCAVFERDFFTIAVFWNICIHVVEIQKNKLRSAAIYNTNKWY